MIKIKTKEEIEIMRESALVVSKTLGMLAKEVKPGVSTLYLDKLAEEFIREQGAIPGFLGLYDFPNTLCMSPNSQVVHGIPNKTPLKEGDIISIDCGALKNDFYGDHAYTFAIGEVDEETKKSTNCGSIQDLNDSDTGHAHRRVLGVFNRVIKKLEKRRKT